MQGELLITVKGNEYRLVIKAVDIPEENITVFICDDDENNEAYVMLTLNREPVY